MADRTKTNRSAAKDDSLAANAIVAVTRAKKNHKNRPSTNRTFVDSVVFRVPYTGELPSSKVMVTSAEGEIKWTGQNRVEVETHWGVTNHIVSTLKGTTLLVKTCLPKARFGHNCAGLTNLKHAVKGVIEDLSTRLRSQLDAPGIPEVRPGEVEMLRVDLVRHLRFGTEVQASAIVDEIAHRCQNRGLLLLAQMQGETVTATGNRRAGAVSFYLKSREMRRHPTARRSPDFEEVLAAIEGWVRVEIRVTAATLKRESLSTAKDWNATTGDELFDRLFKGFEFLDLIPVPPSADDLPDNLPAHLSRALALVSAGMDLNRIFSTKHARNLKALAAKHGLDLRSTRLPSTPHRPVVTADRWVTDVPRKVASIRGFSEQFCEES